MTTRLKELLGEELLLNGESNHIATSELCGKTVAIYFSAHWSPSCRTFTAQLVELYKKLDSNVRDKLDIVLVSYDEDQKSFDEHFREMPWKAMIFADRTRAQSLGVKFHVKVIPSLIVLSSSCEVLTWAGVKEVHSLSENALQLWSNGRVLHWTRESHEDEYVWENTSCCQCFMFPLMGKRYSCVDRECAYTLCALCNSNNVHEHSLFEHFFPNTQYSLEQLFASVPYLLYPHNDNNIDKNVLWSDGVKSIGLYFSDFWSRSRIEFTPLLIQAYQEMQHSSDSFKIVFISNDYDEKSFDEYRSEMPWFTVPFHFGAPLKALYSGSGISLLVIISINGKVLARNGHDIVLRKRAEALNTWSKGERVSPPSAEEFIWFHIQCEKCQMNPLIGHRYRCFSCIDLDLCSACAKHGHEHPLELCAQPNEDDE